VFDRPDDRARVEHAARQAGVAFTGLWLETPASTLLARVAARRGGPPDASTDVVRAQLKSDPRPMGWSRLDAVESEASVTQQAVRLPGA